jgi:hypothetical protein
MDYRQGIAALEHILADVDESTQRDFALYKAQVLDNLRDEERYGDTERLRADRYQIVDKLNPLAVRLTGVSFTDHCLGVRVSSHSATEKPGSVTSLNFPTTSEASTQAAPASDAEG